MGLKPGCGRRSAITVLVSPAEHNILRSLGRVSSVTEKFGADFLIPSVDHGVVGVQRKEINDLISSVRDGRLQREVAQMKTLGLGVFLIEGRLQWTVDGVLLANGEWTRAQHLGVIWSLQSAGYWTMSTSDLGETFAWLSMFTKWLTIPASRHRSTKTRPGPSKGLWGKRDNRDWGVHILQGFDGVGYELACRIWDKFDGLPLRWDVDVDALSSVAGIGKVRAARLIEALQGGVRDGQVKEESTTKEKIEWLTE